MGQSLTAHRRLKPRAAYTLVELLVVIAIVMLLLALLAPAVNSAREAARRASCGNNLRNVALALHNYHGAHDAFPPGFVSQPATTPAWGWPAFTMPFLELTALYDALDVPHRRLVDLFAAARGKLESPEIGLLQTRLEIFRCPTDTTPDLLPFKQAGDRHFHAPSVPIGFEPATSNYVGSKGFIDNPCQIADKKSCRNTGIFFGDSAIGVPKITDGTSKTFLLGERDFRCQAGTWIGSRNPVGSGMFGSYMLLARSNLRLNFPLSGAHNTCTEGFSSAHQGGAFFALCDGSVRFVSAEIDFNNGNGRFPNPSLGVFQRLGSRNDEMPVDLGMSP
jgi:competence protein ComGC